MTRSLVITVSAVQRDAVNTALEARGFGPDNLSVPMTDGEPTPMDEDGNLLATPDAWSSHWWVTGPEFGRLQALLATTLAGATFRAQTRLDNPRAFFEATNRERGR